MNEVTMEYNINVVLSKEFKTKIDYYSKNFDNEIGGFIIGDVTNGKVYCEDIIFPKQWISGGEVEFKDGAIGLMRAEYGEEKIAKIIGEWHSHIKMGCFWSLTDLNDLNAQFLADFDFGIFIVSSNGDNLVRAEIARPWSTVLDNLDYTIENSVEEKTQEQVKLEEEFAILSKKIDDYNKKEEKDIETKLLKIVDEKCEVKEVYVKPKSSKKGIWENIDGKFKQKDYNDFTSEDWDNYNDSYGQNINNDIIDRDINYQIYDIFSSDKRDFSIKLENLNPEWKDEIEQTFNIKTFKDSVTYSLCAEITCKDRETWKESKKEVKGLVKLLLDEQSEQSYFKGH